MRVFLYNDGTGKYDIEVTTIVARDLDNNTISFTTDHFSKFGVGSALDTDGDGVSDLSDPDDDNDGIPDGEDALPLDTDNDGLNNADDPDDDADGIPDGDDTYPLDTDNDGLANNIDDDDDGDGYTDAWEITVGSDPLDADSTPITQATPVDRSWAVAVLVLAVAALAILRLRFRHTVK